MERRADRLIMVEDIMDLNIGHVLFIDYPFLKHTPVRNKMEEQGLPKDVLRTKNQRIINECGLVFYNLCCQNCVLF